MLTVQLKSSLKLYLLVASVTIIMSCKSTEQDVGSLTTDAPPAYTEVLRYWSVNRKAVQKDDNGLPPYQPEEQAVQIDNNRHSSTTSLPTPPILNGRPVFVTPSSSRPPLPYRRPEDPVRYQCGFSRLTQDEIIYRLKARRYCVIISTVILFFVGSPLTLIATIPSIYCIHQVYIITVPVCL